MFSVSVHLAIIPLSVSTTGIPPRRRKQGEGSELNAEPGTRDSDLRSPGCREAAKPRSAPRLPLTQPGRGRAASGAPQAAGRGLPCACAGPPSGPSAPGNMAAPIAAPGRALLRAAADGLLRGRVRALLRPQLEGVTPGPERDFSLSHSRVRSGLRDP